IAQALPFAIWRKSRCRRRCVNGRSRERVTTRGQLAAQELEQRLRVYRFHDVLVEAGREGLRAIGGLPVAGEGDEQHARVLWVFSDPTGEREAVDLGEPDVDERDVRANALDEGQALGAGLGALALEARHREELAKEVATVGVVLDDRDACALR